jgi:hypothetical protein
MHRRVNILQYVKTSSGRWQWAPIPKNRRTGAYLWSRAITSTLSGAHKRRRYEKAGTTPSEALEARRRKEFELMGRAVLEQGKQIARTDQTGMTIESAAADYQEQLCWARPPNETHRHGPDTV